MSKKASQAIRQMPPAKRSFEYTKSSNKPPKKEGRYSHSRLRQYSLSIMDRWKQLTIKQKALIVATGVIVVAVAYRLIPLIIAGLGANSVRTSNTSTTTIYHNSTTTFSPNNTHPVCPVRPINQAKVSSAAAVATSSTPQQTTTKIKSTRVVLKDDLESVINKTRIAVKPSFRAFLASQVQGAKKVALVEGEIARVKKALPQTMSSALLHKILQDPTFSIELVAYNDAELTSGGTAKGANARYLPFANKILFGIDTDMSESEIRVVLANEMHHVAVRYTNYNRQLSPDASLPKRERSIEVLRPAVADEWKTNHTAVALHKKAQDVGFARVKQFEKLLKEFGRLQHGSSAAKSTKQELNKYLMALIDYEPQIYTEEMSIDAFKVLRRNFKKEGEKTVIPSTPPAYLVRVDDSPSGVVLRYTYAKSTNIHDKATAFIADMNKIQSFMQHPAYRKQPQPDQDLEASSFLQEVNFNTLKVFFHEWCQYFSDYHTLDLGQYCHP